jgi:hypothetical protein
MAKGMAKVFTTFPMEINIKVNLKMTNWMANVLFTMLMATNKRECIRMDSKWAAISYDLWKN